MRHFTIIDQIILNCLFRLLLNFFHILLTLTKLKFWQIIIKLKKIFYTINFASIKKNPHLVWVFIKQLILFDGTSSFVSCFRQSRMAMDNTANVFAGSFEFHCHYRFGNQFRSNRSNNMYP